MTEATKFENDVEQEYKEELARLTEEANRPFTRDDKIALLAEGYEYTTEETVSANIDFIAELHQNLLDGKIKYVPYLELLRENSEVHVIALQIALESKKAKEE